MKDMTFFINKNEMFELLKSENFIIGIDLIDRSKSLIERITNKKLNNFSQKRIIKLTTIFKSLRNQWKHLKGGRQRLNFSEKNLKEKIILKIEESEFNLVKDESVNELAIEILPEENLIQLETEDKNPKTICHQYLEPLKVKSYTRSSIRIRRRIHTQIQNQLTKSNIFLEKYGLCFGSIEILDSSQHTYNYTFKLSKQLRQKIIVNQSIQKKN